MKEGLHFDNEWFIHMNSKNNEDVGYGRDLHLLIILRDILLIVLCPRRSGRKVKCSCFRPLTLDSSCATLLAQTNVAHRSCVIILFPFSWALSKLIGNLWCRNLQIMPIHSSLLKEKDEKRTLISRYWCECELVSMFFAYKKRKEKITPVLFVLVWMQAAR